MRDIEKKIYLSVGVLVAIILIVGISYALWTFNIAQSGVNTITSGCLKLEMTNESDAISITNAYPISDEEGLKLTPYSFTITNLCSSAASYNISLEVMNTTDKLSTNYIAVSVDNGTKKILNTLSETETTYNKGDYTPYEGRLLVSGTLKGNESKEHTIRLWLDEATPTVEEAMNKTFISKVVLNASIKIEYTEALLNGADPVLKDNLIPVVIDNSGNVTKANTSSEWYKYEDKKWANAVILEDETVTYNDGEEIPEDNIESYFVWIPRYKYKIWTNGDYEADTATINEAKNGIDIIFENKDTTPSTDTTIGSYYTHPAFVSMNTNGLWVGKFETGYRDAASTTDAEVNSEDSAKVVVKPNVYSWRGIQPANAFYTTYNYQRSLDYHMMKNTEWGAVAYLTNSQYGRCTNETCVEVTINNNSNYITGYAGNRVSAYEEGTALGVDGTSTYNYKNPLSNVASTTGNYTGVYDMSGGTFEYVMGVMLDSSNTSPLSGNSSSDNSGFKGNYGDGSGSNTTGRDFPESKYYDTYTYGTSREDYTRFKYGDATGELGPSIGISWYEDFAHFVRSMLPWFLRGGDCGSGANTGVFSFEYDYGSAVSWGGFRIVLSA